MSANFLIAAQRFVKFLILLNRFFKLSFKVFQHGVEFESGSFYEKTHTITSSLMKLSSSAFTTEIPSMYTCDGENVNPPLSISEVPVGTQSLALIVDDPDAPSGDWVHWLVWDIDPTTTQIAENSVPGTQGTNDFGKPAWGGPCPPSGTHRYFFKLYALDNKLELPSTVKKADLLDAMQRHILEETELVGNYQRL